MDVQKYWDVEITITGMAGWWKSGDDDFAPAWDMGLKYST